MEERSEEVRDDGGSGTVEARVQGSEEVKGDSERVQGSEEAGEVCGPSSSSLRSSEEVAAATKRRRLSEITAMGDEPLQA